MTDDLVKRLRGQEDGRPNCTRLACVPGDCNCQDADRDEAADRIEQLEAALREIKDWNDNQDRRSLKIAAVIEAALAGEKKDAG